MDDKQIVMEWLEGWKEEDRKKLIIADDLHHISPDSHFENADTFMDACWGKLGPFDYELKKIISEGDTVAVWYEFIGSDGARKPICEWFTIKDGLVKEIRVFYR